MPMTMTPDEAADLLGRILALDVRIEDLTCELARVEIKRKGIKSVIAETVEERDKLSYEIRNPPDMPIFDGAGPGPESTDDDDGLSAQDDLLAGVREVEMRALEGPATPPGPPPIVEPDETVQVFCCNRCNVQRPGLIHPCPACECPEYRLVDVPREVAAELHARWVGDEEPAKKRPRRSKAASPGID